MTMPDGLSFGFMGVTDRGSVAALEDLPIDSLWVGGHVASPNPTPEAMVELARLSAAAERVRIGTAILLLPLYPPAVVAKQVADLDRVTGGRVTLGVGVGGEYPAEFRACGVELTSRGRRTDEAIGLLRRFWTGEPVTHHGDHFAFDDVRIHPAPTQGHRLPVVVAGRQPVAMRRAAALGDGWMPYLFSARRYAASVETIRAAAAESGRDLAGFEWMVFVFVAVDDDPRRAREAVAGFLGGTYRQDFDAMVDSVAVAGTPDEVVEKLQAFVDAGARHFIFTLASRDGRVAAAERLMADIVPQLTGGSP